MKKNELTKLSREEKLEFLKKIDERKRRRRERAEVYTPNPGQQEVHDCNKLIRAVFSGNGAGKSCLAVNEAIWAAKGYNPVTKEYTKVPTRGIIVLDAPSKVTDQYLPEFMKWMVLKPEQLKRRGKTYVEQITFDNGSEILFMFHGQEPMLFESLEADWIIADEPMPRKIYISLMRGLRKKGARPWVLMLGTPITAAWMRKEIYEPWAKGEAPDTECFKFASDVNKKNLNWDFYENTFFKKLSKKEEQIRRHGEFFDLEGLALAHLFDETVHVIPPFKWPDGWSTVTAIDPHQSKPTIISLLGCSPQGQLYYIKETSIPANIAPQQVSELYKDFKRGFRVIDEVCDSLGSAPKSGGEGDKSFIQCLQEYGHNVRATTYKDKNDESFIQEIKQVLYIPENGKPKLLIFHGNKGIKTDIENVEWAKFRNIDEYKEKLEISNKDFLATLKYALATGISYLSSKPRVRKSVKRGSPWGRPS
jgi:hypothetical protein